MQTRRQLVRPRQAVILAGGRGARMRPFTDSAPKHMYPFHGRPFAHWLVEQLAEQGFERVLFLLGYLPEPTRRYFGDGRRFGLDIRYQATPAEWESGPRVKAAREALEAEFLLCYCDNIWPLRILEAWQAWRRAGTLVQTTVYENSDGYTRSNVSVDCARRITQYDPERKAWGLGAVDIGYALVARAAVADMPSGNVSFASALYPPLAARGELSAWMTQHRYYSAGSPERLAATEAFLARRPAVLVDRDGVLNRRPPAGHYVKSWAEWEWLPGAREAVARLHQAGYRIAIVSNQAGIARGVVTPEAVEEIHARLRADVEASGGAIDAIYVCPHHWEAGCACRKPRPGMLFQAQRDLHLDLTRTWFVGDDERDAEAAEAAGCRFAMVSERASLARYAAAWLEQQDRREACVSC